MSLQKTSDLRIAGRQEVISANFISKLPISETSSETVFNAVKSSQIFFIRRIKG